MSSKCGHKKRPRKGRKQHNAADSFVLEPDVVKDCMLMWHHLHWCRLHNIVGGCFHSGAHVCRCGLRLGI